jgi:hypothetical protein
MSKLSQCAKCVKDRRNCGQYIPEDMDCPQYVSAREDDGENAFAQKVGIGYTTFYVGFVYVIFTIGLANYFENPMVYYIFAIPIILLVIWGIVKYMINRKKRKSMKTNKEEMEQIRITLPDSTTRTSLMVTLRKLNLQYEFDGNQNIMVTYQGEVFRIIAENDSYWIHIQDCWWYNESLDDIDNLALLHRAVNECNIRDTNKMVYTYNKIEREVGLHILRDILWMPQIPTPDQYLQTTFDTMLRSHHFFFRMMEELRREEFKKHN